MAKKESNKKIELKTLWAILCKSASVDQHTNQLSIFNMIENVAVNKTPNPITPLSKITEFPQKTQIKFDYTLAVLFERNTMNNSAEFNPYMEIKLVDPTGEELIKNEVPVQFEEGKNRVRAIVVLDSLLVTKSGKYDYIISARNSPLESLTERTHTSIQVKIYE